MIAEAPAHRKLLKARQHFDSRQSVNGRRETPRTGVTRRSQWDRTMGVPLDPQRRKLTSQNVREIRRLRVTGVSLSHLADQFGISRQWLCLILRGDVWNESKTRRGSRE
jgi:hypothetical protein